MEITLRCEEPCKESVHVDTHSERSYFSPILPLKQSETQSTTTSIRACLVLALSGWSPQCRPSLLHDVWQSQSGVSPFKAKAMFADNAVVWEITAQSYPTVCYVDTEARLVALEPKHEPIGLLPRALHRQGAEGIHPCAVRIVCWANWMS